MRENLSSSQRSATRGFDQVEKRREKQPEFSQMEFDSPPSPPAIRLEALQ
jgi:hypothetical protein